MIILRSDFNITMAFFEISYLNILNMLWSMPLKYCFCIKLCSMFKFISSISNENHGRTEICIYFIKTVTGVKCSLVSLTK